MPDIFDEIATATMDVFDEISQRPTAVLPTPDEAAQRETQAAALATKPDALTDYDKQVMFFYNWLKTTTPEERGGAAISRFANPLGLRRWLSRKFGSGEEAAWFDALDAYAAQLSWTDPEKIKHFLVGAEQAALTFKGIGATGVTGITKQFALQEAIQAPREGETLGGRILSTGESAIFGTAVGAAGRYIPKARWRIPTTVGGAALVTAAGGGNAKQIMDSAANMFGWEVIGLAQRGADKWQMVTKAREFNPELNKVPADEIERGIKQAAEIQSALVKPEEGKPTIAAERVTPAIIPEHREAMKAALAQAAEIEPIVKREIGEARTRVAGGIKPRIESLQKKGLPTEEAIQRSIPPGPMTSYANRFPSLRGKVPDEALESYFATIPANEALRPFQVRNVGDAFTKLVDGSYLTLTEAGYLVKHFKDIAPEIAEAAKGRVPMGDKVWQTVKEIINIPYTTLTNVWDVSGLGRQGRFLMQRYPEMAKGFTERYFKSFFSEEATTRIVNEYQTSPNLERAISVGKLQITELPSFYEPMTATEETQLATPLLERIPIVGKYVIRPTARSFTSSLNWYRVAIVDRAISAADRIGEPLTDKQLEQLCSNINDMSGRSSIPRSLQQIAPFINALFAPRFTISRSKLIGKAYYDPDVAIAWASLIATNYVIMNLVKMLHPDAEIEPDLRMADGGKLKVGETRYDLWAGELPYVRSLMRLTTGQTKTASGHIMPVDYKKEFVNIIRSRENPLFSLITDALTGKNYIGEEFGAPPRGKAGEILTEEGIPEWAQGMTKEAWNRMGPLTMQDVVDTFVEEGVGMAITAGIASSTGIGVQTYPETKGTTLAKTRDQFADETYGKKWEDLSERQQRTLQRKYKAELGELELAKKVERAETIDYDYVGKLVEDEKRAGKAVAAKLSPEAQANLKQLGIQMGLSRKIGDYVLNDERYQKYQDLTAQYLDKRLTTMVTRTTWQKAPPERKTERINAIVESAKARARAKVLREANVGNE